VYSPQERHNREEMLSLARGTIARAVSLSIACGEDAYLAVQSSEIGRGILAAGHIDLQTGSGPRASSTTLSKDEMTRLAQPSLIVILNASEIRCDAILITSDGINYHSLEKLDPTELQRRAEDFVRVTDYDYSLKDCKKNDRIINEILQWLWNDVVEPILDKLGFEKPPSEDKTWPRVW
jgi:hypothetical protein